jgi:hypothetical protein
MQIVELLAAATSGLSLAAMTEALQIPEDQPAEPPAGDGRWPVT